MESTNKVSREDQHKEFMTEVEKLQGIKKDATSIFAIVTTKDELKKGHYFGALLDINGKNLIEALVSVLEEHPDLVNIFEKAIALHKIKSNPLAAFLDLMNR